LRDERNYWETFANRRLSRRGAMRGAGVAGIGLTTAALVGCGDDDDDDGGTGPPATTNPTTPGQGQVAKTGGTLKLHMGGSPRSLDPHFDTFPYNTAITDNTNERLLRFTSDLSKIETELAAKLPETPDPLTFTIKLQPGIKYQNVDPTNGREFVAADVKYSLERQMTDQAGKFQHAYFFLGAIDKIDVPDATTVSIKMKKPYAPMLSYLASPWTVMIAKEAVDKWTDLTEHAVGTGPFILKDWQKDVKFVLTKNPDYREKGKPYVDSLEYLIAIDPDTSATLFIDKQVNGAVLGTNQKQRVKDARKDIQYEAVPSQFWRQFRMSPTTPEAPYVKPFSDIRFREAVVRAIDKKQVLDLVYNGDGVLTNGPILPIYTQWALKEELAGFDLKKATDLMGQSGVGSFDGDLIWATGTAEADQIGEILKQQLAKIKVNLSLKPMELAAYYNLTYSYKYTFSHHVPLNNPDPDENLSSYFGRKSAFFKHNNPVIWDIIDKQAGELDLEKRKAIVKEAQEMIVKDFPMSFMFTVNLHEFTDKTVKGWFYPKDLYDGRKADAWLDV
jgi:peptide/nickel transport system substrate-binding protein